MEDPANPAVTHVAYVRGSNVVVNVRFVNDNNFTLSGTLTWEGARLEVPKANKTHGTDFTSLTVPSGGTSITLAANGGTQEVTLTLTGVPNYVAVGQLELRYNLPLTNGSTWGNNGTHGGYENWERVCLVDTSPVGLQSVPWTDFLEYSCRWAFGYTGATNMRKEVTRGLHYSNRCPWNQIQYDPGQLPKFLENAFTIDWTGYPTRLRLKVFINAMEASGPPWNSSSVNWVQMQCSDFAAILNAAIESQGVDASCDLIASSDVYDRWANDLDPDNFYYWPLCRAGDDSTDGNSYHSSGFGFHVLVRSNSVRYDSAASYYFKYDTSTWMNPVWEWPIADHWQKHTGSVYCGLAYSPTTSASYPFGDSVAIMHSVDNMGPAEVTSN